MHFEWDPAKDERCRQQRGFGFNFAALIVDGDTIEWMDDRRDHGEARVRAIGEADGLVLHVVFIDRGDLRRMISARVANRKERDRWRKDR